MFIFLDTLSGSCFSHLCQLITTLYFIHISFNFTCIWNSCSQLFTLFYTDAQYLTCSFIWFDKMLCFLLLSCRFPITFTNIIYAGKEKKQSEYNHNTLIIVRSEVPMAVKMLMLVFWVVVPCGLVSRYRCFVETYSLHLQP
jgi:hypothetical protein